MSHDLRIAKEQYDKGFDVDMSRLSGNDANDFRAYVSMKTSIPKIVSTYDDKFDFPPVIQPESPAAGFFFTAILVILIIWLTIDDLFSDLNKTAPSRFLHQMSEKGKYIVFLSVLYFITAIVLLSIFAIKKYRKRSTFDRLTARIYIVILTIVIILTGSVICEFIYGAYYQFAV